MNVKAVLYLFFTFISGYVFSQEVDSLKSNETGVFSSDSIISNEASSVVLSGDSLLVDLKMISVYGLPKFNNDLDRKQYEWLKKKVYNLYPYLTLAVEQYGNLQDSIKTNKDNSQFKKYVKKRQKQLSEEYETKLKGLTKTEGQIFSKLMYRSTGKTVYEIIKELRSSWSAFWWNAKAGAFDIDLKEPYDPVYNRDDAYIESILLRAYQFGELKPLKKHEM